MSDLPSLNTRAILLLTAPLLVGRNRKPSPKPLAVGEYNRLARWLRKRQREPADLLGHGAGPLLKECELDLAPGRLDGLLDRGFLLSQAMERWRMRALWVMSRADAEYPLRLKRRLRELAPPVLYGCGNRKCLDTGGLAVVGSRNVDDALISYTEGVGSLAADAGRTVVSGGARGIDQAAMRGALNSGGRAAGVLADGLERAAVRREYRGALLEGRLVLTCPYDPSVGFLVGHAMQRNKLIYALADAALVVSADFGKGGTWAGATEQLDRLRFVPLYVRSAGEMGRGLEALVERGARQWSIPENPEAFDSLLFARPGVERKAEPAAPGPDLQGEQGPPDGAQSAAKDASSAAVELSPSVGVGTAEELLATVRDLLLRYLAEPRTEDDVAESFEVRKQQGRRWLKRLVAENAIERLPGPTRYRAVADGNSRCPNGIDDGWKPSEQLFASVRRLLLSYLDEPRDVADVAAAFDVQKNQAEGWLRRLVSEGVIRKLNSTRFRAAGSGSTPLFPARAVEARSD